MFVDFHILNELGSPSINSNTFANRPPAGQIGRLFVSTDTFEIYRDNGTTWDLIGGPGSSTVTGTGAATQVAYWTASQAIGGSNNLWWDNTNGYLGVKTNTPTAGINVVQTDGQAILSDFTTVAGSGNNAVAIYGRNTTNSSGYVAVLEEKTPNSASGQYPIKIMHSLSSGTAAANMATGIHFSLPDDAGTERINQFSMDTVDPAAATYSSRYRFVLRQNGSAATPFYITGAGIGVFTGTPTSALDVHSTGVIAQLNSTGTTNNAYLAFQRNGSGVWRLGDNYNSGNNQFEIHNTVLTVDAVTINAATNKTSWQAQETYTTGLARGNYFDFNLSVSAGGSFSSPNAITALGASLDLTLAGNATIPSGARSGLDAYNTISFTGTGTLTHSQGTQIRAYSNVTAGWAFAGSATGTITHLAGLRVLFPDNSGSAVTITNNYGLLINDQTANTGTVTYTNRWGIYQEGASDLNYMAANLLLGSVTNSGEKLQVTGTSKFTDDVTINKSSGNALFNITSVSGTYPYITLDQTSVVKWAIQNVATSGLFTITESGVADRFVISKTTGLVGIGTNSPTRLLDVNGVIRTRNSGSAGAPSIELGTSAQGNGIFYPATNTLAFATNDTERLRLDSIGNFVFTNDATFNQEIFYGLSQTSANCAVFRWKNTGLSIHSYGQAYGSQLFVFPGSSNVGIGTTTDAGQKLQVNGDSYTTGLIKNNYLSLRDDAIEQYQAASDNGTIAINYVGYNGGTAYFRDFAIYDGKGSLISYFDGSNKETTLYGSIKTAAPTTGTAANWKLGSRVAATVVVNTNEYIEVDIGGTLYKLATVT